MRSVHVGIRHNDYFVITEFIDIEFVRTDARAKCGNDCSYFNISQNFIEPGFFHVEDLSPKRENCLVPSVASLFCRASGRVAFNQVNLTFIRVGIRTIGKFSRQTASL